MFKDYYKDYSELLPTILGGLNDCNWPTAGGRKPIYSQAEMNRIKKRRAKKKTANITRKRNRNK